VAGTVTRRVIPLRCVTCGASLDRERVLVTNYWHCMNKECVAVWQADRDRDYRLEDVPKSNTMVTRVAQSDD
jgi:hypothetical protein